MLYIEENIEGVEFGSLKDMRGGACLVPSNFVTSVNSTSKLTFLSSIYFDHDNDKVMYSNKVFNYVVENNDYDEIFFLIVDDDGSCNLYKIVPTNASDVANMIMEASKVKGIKIEDIDALSRSIFAYTR